jgi:glycosyltransferase involved in cell wall biosynthesis
MKILQVAHSFVPYTMAGAELYTYKLSKELSRKNSVWVFFRVNLPKEKEYALLEAELQGFRTCAINHTFRFIRSFGDTYTDGAIDSEFGRLLDRVRPDIVHIQHLLFLSLGMIDEIKKRDIPLVYTLHDYWLICYRGQLIKDDFSICAKGSIPECRECLKYLLRIKPYSIYFYSVLRKFCPPRVLGAFKNIYLKLVKSRSLKDIVRLKDSLREARSKIDLFIAPSNFIKDIFINNGIPQEKIVYSPYGFDKLSFSGRVEGNPGRKVLNFGYIGTLLPMKGIDILISAFQGLKSRDIKLSVYGKLFSYSGFEAYPEQLRNKSAKDPRIALMGGYDNKDVAGILNDFDVVVVPSIWQENAPLVIQEAFLAGKPVIASRIGGIPELVTDGVNGLLFNPGDPQDLREKLEYIIDNPGILTKFSDNSPEVKSIEADARETEQVYAGLIAKERAGHESK